MAVKFEAKLPREVPASAAAYATRPVKPTPATLRATGKSLGLAGAEGDVITSTDLLAYNEGRHRLEIHLASGAVAFYHRDKYGREPKKAFELSDRRADAIARKFLDRSKIADRSSAQLARVTHMHSAVADVESQRVRETMIDAGVVYRRKIDDLLVEGPGGFAMVTVDPTEEVIGFRCVWRQLGRRLGTVKLKQPEEAMRAVERLAAKLPGDIVVTKAALGYFELGPLDRQRAIEPAYSFVYVLRSEEVAVKSAFVMHAGEKRFGQLMGKKRFPAADQKTRKEG